MLLTIVLHGFAQICLILFLLMLAKAPESAF
jgi:hypothetical protein